MGQGDKRVLAIDFARGLAVVFMIFIHVLVTYGEPAVRQSLFGLLVGFFGGPPAAPVFMALMGISSYYSRNQDWRNGVRRGLKIVMLGYVLNFFRGVLPIWIAFWLLPEKAAQIPGEVADVRAAFLELDILHFAGLALIFMALLRKWKVNSYLLLGAAVAAAAVGPMMWGRYSDMPLLGHFIDYLWGDKPSTVSSIGNLVSFPFFPWISFVLVGMVMGECLTQSGDVEGTLRKAALAGLVVCGTAAFAVSPDVVYQMGDYYHARFYAVMMMAGFVPIWLFFCHIVVNWSRSERINGMLFQWSRHVNSLYMIQWVLVMAGADWIFGFNRCSLEVTATLMLVITIITHLCNEAYLQFKKTDRQVKLN